MIGALVERLGHLTRYFRQDRQRVSGIMSKDSHSSSVDTTEVTIDIAGGKKHLTKCILKFKIVSVPRFNKAREKARERTQETNPGAGVGESEALEQRNMNVAPSPGHSATHVVEEVTSGAGVGELEALEQRNMNVAPSPLNSAAHVVEEVTSAIDAVEDMSPAWTKLLSNLKVLSSILHKFSKVMKRLAHLITNPNSSSASRSIRIWMRHCLYCPVSRRYIYHMHQLDMSDL
jgi:hypothetical protein